MVLSLHLYHNYLEKVALDSILCYVTLVAIKICKTVLTLTLRYISGCVTLCSFSCNLWIETQLQEKRHKKLSSVIVTLMVLTNFDAFFEDKSFLHSFCNSSSLTKNELKSSST